MNPSRCLLRRLAPPQGGEFPCGVGRRRGIPAWLLSAALHAALFVTASVMIDTTPRGAAVEADRKAGIVLVSSTKSPARYYSESDAASRTAPLSAPAQSSTNPLPNLNNLPVELAVALPQPHDLSSAAGGAAALPTAGQFTMGSRPSTGVGGGQAQTQVFGASGTGSKFVYVFDRSASMEGFQGRPMEAAKAALIASLHDLGSVHQFQIVFYNERTTVFNPFHPRQPRILFGTDENKRMAEEFIRAMAPQGGTRHLEAVELALGMRPDVIFFLTDANEPQLTPGQLDGIRRRNRGGTTIHAIEFGAGPSQGRDNFLVRLARQNNGRHVYVDVSRLR